MGTSEINLDGLRNRFLTINEIIELFDNPLKLKKRNNLSDLLDGVCKASNIKDWDEFKKGNKRVLYFSKILNKAVNIYGDDYETIRTRSVYGYKASEIEFILENGISGAQLKKIDFIKEAFDGYIISKQPKKKRGNFSSCMPSIKQ